MAAATFSLSELATRLLAPLKGQAYQITPFGQEALTCEAVEKITGLAANQIGKAMVVHADQQKAVVLLAANQSLDTAAVKRLLQAKKVFLVQREQIPGAIGLIAGAVTPLIVFERPELRLIIDQQLWECPSINISSGDPCFGVNLSPQTLAGLKPLIAQISKIKHET